MNLLKIKSIKYIGKRKTFDLHVKDNHNFFLSNGVLSHNSGKTWCMMTVMQGYHSKGYKILDMFGGKRNENSFWCFPSDERLLWQRFNYEVGNFKSVGPKEYEVNLLYPCFSSLLPKRIPQLLPRIKSKIFTIPIHSITIEDISVVIGPLSNEGKYVWNFILKNTNKKSTGTDIEYIMNTNLNKYRETVIYKSFIKPALDEHLISSDICDLNLDLESEMKNKNVITNLCHEYIPINFRYFIMKWLLRNVFDLANNDKIGKKNIAVFREASLFMKVEDKNPEEQEITQIFRNTISDIARYCRSGIFIAADTQSPREVRGLIEGQADAMFIKEMPSPSDREILTKQLKFDKFITDAYIRYIARIPKEQVIVVGRGERAKLVRKLAPPRTKCWKDGDTNFINTWAKLYDSWINTENYVMIIEDEYKKRDIEIKTEHMKLLQEKKKIEEISNDENNDAIEKDVEVVKKQKIKKKLNNITSEIIISDEDKIKINELEDEKMQRLLEKYKDGEIYA